LSKYVIGVSQNVLWDLGLVRAISTAAQIGYSAFELWAEPMILDPLKVNLNLVENLRLKLIELNLRPSIHAAQWDLNLASINPHVQRLSIQYAKAAVILASLLNAEVVVVHPGKASSSTMSDRDVERLAIRGLVEVVRYAADKGMKIAIENIESTSRYFTFSGPNEINELIEQVEDLSGAEVGLALDVAHASTVMSPEDYIKQLDVEITHLHVSDTTSTEVHLPLGEGNLNFNLIFSELRARNFKGFIIVEGYVPGRNVDVAARSFSFLQKVLSSI